MSKSTPPAQYLAEAIKKELERQAAKEARDKYLDKWAAAVCPLKIGAIVNLEGRGTNKGRVEGLRGQLSRDGRQGEVLVSYKPLRADGSDSLHYKSHFYWYPGKEKP